MNNEAYDGISPKLLNKKNVCGTATGVKWVDGKPTEEPAVLVFVQHKLSQASVISKYSADDVIPHNIDGINIDVIEVGDLKKQNFTQKVRPLVAGYSCGHNKTSAGTMGGFFFDRSQQIVMLSNNHVVSNENNASIGDPIFQPGLADSRKAEMIGKLKDFKLLENNGNTHDSGIVAIEPDLVNHNLISDLYPHIKMPLKDITEPKISLPVQKFGRTTGHTFGNIIGLNGRFKIGFDKGALGFVQCIVVSAMSKAGDSGSLILDMDMNIVGLLFAGSDRVTLANPIKPIMEHYGLKIWKPQTLVEDGWQKLVSSGTLTKEGGEVYTINEYANHFCFLEKPLSGNVNSVSCYINTGSDQGATWGPGIGLQFRNGTIAVNLRYSGCFGGYINDQQILNIGKTKPHQAYGVRIRKSNNTWVGQVRDDDKWYNIFTVPFSAFPGEPIAVRVGKIGPRGTATNYVSAGAFGECSISEIRAI